MATNLIVSRIFRHVSTTFLQKFLTGPDYQIRVFKSGPASQLRLAQHLLAKGRNVVLVLPSSADLPLYSSLASLLT